MKKTPKIFLALSVSSFILSYVPYFTDIGWGILRPAGAVSFILFFITNLLAREMETLDADPANAAAAIPAPASAPRQDAPRGASAWGANQRAA